MKDIILRAIFFLVIANVFNCIEIKLIKSLDENLLSSSTSRSISPLSGNNLELEKIFNEVSIKLEDKKSDGKKLLKSSSKEKTPGSQKDEISKINKLSKIGLGASRSLMSSYSVGSNNLGQYKAPAEFCPFARQIYCDFANPYRSLDGACNNRNHIWWGQSVTPFRRLLAPAYDDGIDAPRTRSVTGSKLPNARQIALLIDQPNKESARVSVIFAHFAQFVDHDISLTSLISDQDGKPIKCFCDRLDADCINVEVPFNDKFNKDERCMVTPRSTPSYRKFNCPLGAREQLNLLTHWLDLSQTYGNDVLMNFKLRLHMRGQLNSSVIPGNKRHALPFTLDGSCLNIPEKSACFQSGDPRTNQNGMLMTIQTLWMREHNRVAAKLGELNPYWEDERLFQEARRLVTAKYQHIIYNEFLPILVGRKVGALYNLIPLNQNYFYGYDANLYPVAINEFSTAAYRFGHTLVTDSFHKADENYHILRNITLKNTVFKTDFAFDRDGIDSLLRGSLIKQGSAFDPNVNNFLVNDLFDGLDKESPTKRFSLPALNINRGRDHGLPGYNYYRSLCGLNYAQTFDDLYNMPKSARDDLAKIYKHVNDIDLYTGGVSEHPIEGGVVGPTFACIIAKQFRDLKLGDRYYYENGHEDLIKFNEGQLNEIRKSTMARVLCDNVDISYVQKNSFLKADLQLNPLINCDLIDDLDYNLWKAYYY